MQRREFIKKATFLALAAGFAPSLLYAAKSENVIRRRLDIESNYGFTTDLTDQFLEEGSHIQVTSPEETLKAIGGVIRQYVPRGSPVQPMMAEALENGGGLCDVKTVLYLGIGQLHDLPLNPLLAPGHTFIEWDQDQPIYWDSTSHKEQNPLRQGKYMTLKPDDRLVHRLSYEEFDTVTYDAIGNFLRGYNKLDDAIKAYQLGLDAFPKNVATIHNLGYAIGLNGDLDKAIELFDEAIELNPYFMKVYGLKSAALEAQQEYQDAFDVLEEGKRKVGTNKLFYDAQKRLQEKMDSAEGFFLWDLLPSF